MLDWWGYEIAVAILLVPELILDTEDQNAVVAGCKGDEILIQSYENRKPRRCSLSLSRY